MFTQRNFSLITSISFIFLATKSLRTINYSRIPETDLAINLTYDSKFSSKTLNSEFKGDALP